MDWKLGGTQDANSACYRLFIERNFTKPFSDSRI